MAGMGFILGGALKGYGDSKLEQAKAKREAALEELRWQRQMTAAGEQRTWAEGESEKDRTSREKEGELNRSSQAERDKRNDEARAYEAAATNRDKVRQEAINQGSLPEEADALADKAYARDVARIGAPKFKTEAEMHAAIKAGEVVIGQPFIGPDGLVAYAGLGETVDTTEIADGVEANPPAGVPGHKDFANTGEGFSRSVERGGFLRPATPSGAVPREGRYLVERPEDDPFGARN